MKTHPTIGLALGSGGARGLAHIGVIKVLEKNNIPIDFIAGSSIGAMIGGIYAVTKDIGKIEKIALSNTWHQVLKLILDPSIKGGLISGQKIEAFIQKQIGHISFNKLKIPFVATATDLKTGRPVVLKTGRVSSAIKASISIPLIFKPVKKGDQLLVDSGFSQPVPVKAVRAMGAKMVIAVNLGARYSFKGDTQNPGYYMTLINTLNLVHHLLSKQDVKTADLVVNPRVEISGLIGWRDFIKKQNSQKLILAGERVMNDSLPQLKKIIKYQRAIKT